MSEPAVRGLRDDLINHKVIATFCFLADVLRSTNVQQTILQGARLNFLKILDVVVGLIQTLQKKSEHPEGPKGSYFDR